MKKKDSLTSALGKVMVRIAIGAILVFMANIELLVPPGVRRGR
jgi:hypothetical protein